MSTSRTGMRLFVIAVSVSAVVAGLTAGTAAARPEQNSTARSTPGAVPIRAAGPAAVPSPASGLQPNGRLLTPAGEQVDLGTLPMGGAITDDGRFLWTVSSGILTNDVRVVDLASRDVCAVLNVPGASGGIALDSAHRLAYVSGLPNSRWQPTKDSLPGARGDVVHVFSWTSDCSQIREVRTIPLPLPAQPPLTQAFPPPRAGLPASPSNWPMKLSVTADGRRLLVALNLSDSAAIVDLASDTVRLVPVGGYPFGAATIPRQHLGLVSNEASGTVSVVDLQSGRKIKDITVGAPLSHPQGIVVNRGGTRAYVALSASDQVVVLDLTSLKVARTIGVGRSAGLGTKPTALALSPDEQRLFVAESGADELTVVALPGSSTTPESAWEVVGRIPTAAQPQAVATTPARDGRPAGLVYVSAEGMGIGPNPAGPNPTLATDPIFWAFSPNAPTVNVFGGTQYTAKMVRGRAGILPLPDDGQVRAMTPAASRQLVPTNAKAAPEGTPLRAGGPIKHVFFLVRENRTYDQLLGDVAAGNGDPKLTVFGKDVTPNLHALVARFPLLDATYANSEASIQGHYWTASAGVPDYVTRNWVHQYSGRGRPNDFGTYAVTWPGNGYLFNQAEKQGVSYYNYGEAFVGGYPQVPDRNRTPALLRKQAAVQTHSDLGPPFGGCFPGDMSIGQALDGGQIFDSSMPAGAPAGAYSRVDCFKARFAAQLAEGKVPALNYFSFTSDHTRGTQPGFPVPTAMVADSDLAIGQMVDIISHSSVWAESAIFIVEDDSQDGADHVNAHRIPVAVISPYARPGAVIHTRYDLVSVVRSMELILGMDPLSINDAAATPMYDAFTDQPVNSAPYTALVPNVDLMEMNTTASPDYEWSMSLPLESPDRVSQADLDIILWHSVYGAKSTPPPPGPGAEGEKTGAVDLD
jgi:YVTN family beta-propeller protein